MYKEYHQTYTSSTGDKFNKISPSLLIKTFLYDGFLRNPGLRNDILTLRLIRFSLRFSIKIFRTFREKKKFKDLLDFREMDQVGLSITSYEIQDGQPVRTLTHIFWGDTIDEAVGVAKSHLITDYFFSGSMTGGIKWRGNFIEIQNKTQIFNGEAEKQEILAELTQRAEKINQAREELGEIKIYELLSQK